MDDKGKSWLAGCGCGCLSAAVLFLVVGAGTVFLMWAAYEADLTELDAQVAIPLGVVAGLGVGGVIGTLVLFGMQWFVGRRGDGSSG